jgi:cation diffusion facilitator CzcD-associated flavoprotein CzcO
MKYMKLRHQVHAATWDEKAAVWNVEIENLATGERFVDTAEVLINGTGVLK